MSRENKIKEMLRGHIHEISIPFVVGEIEKMIDEKLFEVEGKVEHVIEWRDSEGNWCSENKHDNKDGHDEYLKYLKQRHPEIIYRELIRTTTDQIVEDK